MDDIKNEFEKSINEDDELDHLDEELSEENSAQTKKAARINFSEINKQVNALAEELVKIDPEESNSPPAMKLRTEIVELLLKPFGSLDRPSQKTDKLGYHLLYFPWLKKEIPLDIYYLVMCEAMAVNNTEPKCWKFNPQKSSFITYLFKFLLPRRLIDYYKQINKINVSQPINNEEKINQSVDEEGRIKDLIEKKCKKPTLDSLPDENVNVERDVLEKMTILADILRIYDERIIYEKKKFQRTFQSIFTNDITIEVKNDMHFAAAVCSENDRFFPKMLLALLTFLMEGTFEKMVHVVENPVKEGINLMQRRKNLANFLQVPEGTVTNRGKRYKELCSDILGDSDKYSNIFGYKK